MTMDIATLGLAVDARQVKDGDRALDNFERTARRTEQSTDRLNKSFDRMSAMLKAAAAAFGAYKLYEHIKEATLLAARYETMGVVMGVAGNNAGYTRREMAELEKQLTKTGISILKSREVLTSLATANIDLSKASNMARASQDLAVVANINSSEAFARMVHGIKSGESEVLRTMGLNVSFENSYKKLAAQLHVNKDALTEQQKVMARTNAVMEESAKYSGIYEESMTTAGKQMKSLERYIEDLKVKAGETFLPVLADGVSRVTEALKAANVELDKAGSEGIISKIGTGLGGAFKIVYQTVAILAANVGFVLNVIGTRIGALFAQVSTLWEAWKGSGVLSPAEFAERMKNAFKAAGDIGDQASKDNENARKALDAYEAKILGVAETDTKTTARMVDNALDKEQARIAAGKAARAEQEAEAKRLKAAEEAAKQQKKFDEVYKSVTKSISERVAALAMESNRQEQLTDGQKFAIKILDDLRTGTLKLSQAKAIQLRKDLESYLALEDENETMKKNREYRDDMIAGYQKGIDAIRAQVDTVKKQVETYGMAESAVLDLAVAEKRRYIESSTWSDEKLDALNAELDALKDLANWTRARENKDAAKKAAEDARAAWEKTAERINDSLTDALMRGFESGKGFAQNLRDTVVNMFKTLILRPIISGILAPIGQGIAQGVGMSAASSAASSMGGSALGSMGMSAFGVGSAAAGFGSGFGAATGITGTGDAAMLASAQAAGNVSTSAAAGAAYGPYIAAALAAYALYKSLDHSGTPHTGGGAIADGAGAKYLDPQALGTMYVQNNDAIQKMTESIATGVTSILNSTASNFNKAGGYSTATAFADDSSRDGAWGALRITQNGNKVMDWNDSRWSRWAPHEYDDGESGMKQYMAGIADAVRKTLDDIGLPAWASKMLKDLGDAPTIEQLGQTVDLINAAQTALNNLGSVINGFANISGDAMTALITASGGLNNLIGKMNSFYDGYYSESEKVANVSKQVKEALASVGVEMPTTRAEFRALVEANLALGEAGAATVSKLLDLAGAFGVVADYAAKTATTTETPATDTSAAVDLANKKRDLEIQIMQMSGNTLGALAAQRQLELAALDPSLKALQERIYALQDEATAKQKLRDAANDALEMAERSIAAERKAKEAAYKAQADAFQKSIKTSQDALNKLQNLSNTLHGGLQGMTAPGASGIDRANAKSQLFSALAIARAGGALPEAGDMQRVIATLSQTTDGMFGTLEDAQRDYYQTAIALSDLAELTDGQATTAEKQLAQLQRDAELAEIRHEAEMSRLDQQLEYAKSLVDRMNGVQTGVTSVEAAVRAVEAAVRAANLGGAALPSSSGGAASSAYSLPDAGGGPGWSNNSAYNHPSGVNVLPTDSVFMTAAKAVYQSMTGGVSTAQYDAAIKANGGTSNIQGIGDPALMRKIYGFASGGQHSGGWRLVGERGPEIEYTPPSQIYSNTDTKDLLDQTPVREEIAALREDFNLFMYQVTKNTGDTAQQLRRWDQNGMPATTTS